MLQDYYTFGTPAFGRICVVIALAFVGMAALVHDPVPATVAVILSALYGGLAVYCLIK